jgi:hypothetical protein
MAATSPEAGSGSVLPAGSSLTPPASVPRRLLFVATVAALGELWIRRHVGWGWDTPWIASAVLFLTAVDAIVGKVVSKEVKESFDGSVRQRIGRALTGRVAMLACIGVILAALVLSSVTIIPGTETVGDGEHVVKAKLVSLAGEEQPVMGDKSVARFRWLNTSPFGRPYRLSVEGYLDEPVVVYPLLGVTITPERDLKRSPSVLFRPPRAAVQSLASDGTFSVRLEKPAGPAEALVSAQHGQEGSFLVGRPQAISAALLAAWRLELGADNVVEPTLDQMLRKWSQFRLIQPERPLAPGMRLVAEVRSRRTDIVDVVARAEVVLGTDAFYDVPMIVVPPGG